MTPHVIFFYFWPKNIMDPAGWALSLKRNKGLLVFMIRYWNHFDPYGSYILHGTETETGTGKQYVSKLRYVLYTLHRGRDRYVDPLFYIVPIPFPVPVPVSVPRSVSEPLV